MNERELVRSLVGDFKSPSGARAREYEVTGALRVFGVAPGRRFTRAIPHGQEQRLIASGAIRPVPARRQPQPQKPQKPQPQNRQVKPGDG